MHRSAPHSSNKGDLAELEGELPLSDRLKAFKTNNFDHQGYVNTNCGSMSEKEVRQTCMHLVSLKKASAEEMRKSVYANYASFIRTSREISNLEGELVSLKNLLSSRGKIIHGIAEGVRVESLSGGTHYSTSNPFDTEDREPTSFDEWFTRYVQNLDVLLAERRVDEALAALEEGEKAAKEARANEISATAVMLLRNTILENRKKLGDQLAESTCQASTTGYELCTSVQAMKKLGDGPRAHTLLFKSHQQRLNRIMQSLHTSNTSEAYTTALSRLVFSTISQAANDSLAIFDDEPAYASELVSWAIEQTKVFAGLIQKNVIAVPAASGCLNVVVECIHISLGHCVLLEDRGLALCPTLLRIFRPYLDEALHSTLKRIDLSTAAIAASDDWLLTHSPTASRSWGTASTKSAPSHLKFSISAHRFNSMVQELCENIGSLDIQKLSEQALEGVMQSFNAYVTMMIHALPVSVETENQDGSGRRIVRIAETVAQQVSLLANAVFLSDELLPRATIKLCPTVKSDDQAQKGSEKQNRVPPEQREVKKKFQRLVEQLRDSFCRQHVLELIFFEDGTVNLNADMYLSMDDGREVSEWFPSPIYQELFIKLTRIASAAQEIFVGRERFATLLLIRLTETLILWFSEDPNFWEEIESGSQRLGPLGLQQFYLDMEFVILFASQGRYLSRNLHSVIKNVIARAIEAVQTNNIDPYSTLPDEEWFTDVAQTAIKMLIGYDDGGDHDAISPRRSISSVQSVGSV